MHDYIDEESVSFEDIINIHSKIFKIRIVKNYKVKFRIGIQVEHYLNQINISFSGRYEYYEIENFILAFEKIGDVKFDEQSFRIEVILDEAKLFLNEFGNDITAYIRLFSNDSEQDIQMIVNSINKKGITDICVDFNVNNQNLNNLLMNLEGNKNIAIFYIERSTNDINQLLNIIFFSVIMGYNLLIESITFDKSLLDDIGLLINKINIISRLYESKMKSLKIKKGLDKSEASRGRHELQFSDIPEYFFEEYKKLENGYINMSQFAKNCGVTRPTAYKYKKMIEENI